MVEKIAIGLGVWCGLSVITAAALSKWFRILKEQDRMMECGEK